MRTISTGFRVASVSGVDRQVPVVPQVACRSLLSLSPERVNAHIGRRAVIHPTARRFNFSGAHRGPSRTGQRPLPQTASRQQRPTS
jgi:hypothetical protein